MKNTSHAAGAVYLFVVLTCLGCAPEPPKAANPVRPIDEPRAVRIIANAFRDSRVQPTPKRSVQLSGGHPVDIDVGAQGHRWGVAYVTSDEKRKLDPASVPKSADDLVVLRGRGADSDARILILLSENYMSDDTVGDEREATTVAAEHRIARDVRDFIVTAQSEKWP